MDDFGTQIRYWCSKRRFSQGELSRKARLTGGHLSRLTTGEKHPTRSTVHLLVEALDLPLHSPESVRLFASVGYIPPGYQPPDPQLLQLSSLLNEGRHEPEVYSSVRASLQVLIEALGGSRPAPAAGESVLAVRHTGPVPAVLEGVSK